MRKAMILTMLLAAAPVLAVTSEGDDATSLSYISYMERFATVQPATDDETLDAIINMPIVPGDRIDTARDAHVEIQLADRSLLWLDEYTSVSFDAIAFSRGSQEDRTVLYLADGTIMLEIPADAPSSHPARLDCGSSTVYLTVPGLYRATRLAGGGLRVEVWDGLAEVSTQSGGVLVHAGTAVELDGTTLARTEEILTRDDTFAEWVAMRRSPPGGDATLHVDARYEREASTLDQYGTWVYIESASTWAWQPDVSGPWSPYTWGRWYWTPAGWSWIPYEPWGALPYHYGTWFFDVSFGWVWCWDSIWGPAWVDWMWWPGYVGWCPRGYYDWWYWNCYWYGYPPYSGGPPHHGHPPYHGDPPHDGHPPGDGQPGRRPLPERGEPVRPPGNGPRPGPEKTTVARTSPVGGEMTSGGGGTVPSPARFASNLEGEIPLDNVDPTPWRVVPTQDFGSPHIGRLARPLEDVISGHEGTKARVVSGPLLTDPPKGTPAGSLIEASFRKIEGFDRDLTPVLSRNPSMDRETLDRLVTPTTTAHLVRNPIARTATPGSRSDHAGRDPRRPSGHDPSLSSWRNPNIHRPLAGGTPASGAVSGGSGSRRGVRSSTAPTLRGGFGGSARRPVGLPSSRPSAGSAPSPSRSGAPSSRAVSPSSGTRSRRPVASPSNRPSVGRNSALSSGNLTHSSPSSSRRPVTGTSGTPVRRYTPSSRSVRPIAPSRPQTWRSPSRYSNPRSSGSSRSISSSRSSSHRSPVRVSPSRSRSHSHRSVSPSRSRSHSSHRSSSSRSFSHRSSGSSRRVSPRR